MGKATERIIKARQKLPPFTAQNAIRGAPGRQTKRLAAATADRGRIETGQFRGTPRQTGPSYRAAIAEMAHAAFAIDEQVQSGVDEVRDIGRGNDHIVNDAERFSRR